MLIGANQSYLLGLFNAPDSNGIITMDLSSLITGSSGTASAAAAPKAPVAPTPPWNTSETPTQASAAVQSALAGHSVIDPNAAQLDLPGASADYKKLFSLYQGLNTLLDVATRAQSKGLSPTDQNQLAKAFANGIGAISDYVDNTSFDQLRLANGALTSNAASTLAITKSNSTYVTPPITTTPSDPVTAFQGPVQFNIAVKRIGITHNVSINLGDMGTTPRTWANVINFMNTQLAAAGVETRFQSQRTAGAPKTITVGSQTITLPTNNPDQYSLKVAVGTSETVTFSAPQTAGAVYVAQTVGDPNPDKDPTTDDSVTQQQLLKFQTDTTNVATPPSISGQGNFVDGRTFADTLGSEVGAVHATEVGPDGSVYLLADVTGTTAGQAIQGDQDVALMKYDSAGHLIYTRTLGAANSATGLGLAVSADGKVAVTGSLTGTLTGDVEGALNSGATGSFADNTDSFVTLYDASGNEVWTERRGSRLNDEASQVAFSADGSTVYVAGRAQGQMPGTSSPIGGYDGYIEGFTTSSKGTPTATFTQSFGTTDSDKPQGMVVNGNSLIVASVEAGHAVLRNYDISSGQPVLSATRDLGDLQGGSIAGLALDGSNNIVVAGTTTNGALAAGTVTRAASGGSDAFAATLSADLSSSSSDQIAYYGGSGNDQATSLAVSNGQIWIAGQAGTDLPDQTGGSPGGMAPVGTKDGFLANLNVATGTVDWSRRFTGKDNMATPVAIAAAPAGSSILDRLGLPSGALTTSDSQLLTAQSSLRAGDTFMVGPGDGVMTKVTIDAKETLQTLATKIQRASGFEATVTVGTNLNGQQQLHIAPANARMTVQIGPGTADKDALSLLGLPEGVVRSTTINAAGQSVPGDGKSQLYGLGISSALNLNDPAQITHALAQISAAMGVVRRAYQDLVTAATPKSNLPSAAAASANGPVPTYLTDQIANLQAGLARLTGGTSA